jgi:hypothetical protein
LSFEILYPGTFEKGAPPNIGSTSILRDFSAPSARSLGVLSGSSSIAKTAEEPAERVENAAETE